MRAAPEALDSCDKHWSMLIAPSRDESSPERSYRRCYFRRVTRGASKFWIILVFVSTKFLKKVIEYHAVSYSIFVSDENFPSTFAKLEILFVFFNFLRLLPGFHG